MIRREDVADLRPGDVVRVTGWDRSVLNEPLAVEGAVHVTDRGATWLGTFLLLRTAEGGAPSWGTATSATLTVVSRAPRPLYVNHDRAEPALGDVVRNADSDVQSIHWICMGGRWLGGRHGTPFARDELPARLRLLVDGETGQAVQ